jgi:serine/threonine-protein kinase
LPSRQTPAPAQTPFPAAHACARCGYLADTSAGPLNFCPKCGLDLRGGDGPEPAPTTSMFLGQVVADRYRLDALLGEGGMGAVYRAEHVRMGKALAVKLLRGSFARDPEAVERFKAEARIVSRLSHPHTIAVFDFGELRSGDGFYLAMEYAPGRDLAAVLRQERRLDEHRAVAIAEQLLGSLAEAHDAGIVHRDVKPANVMLMATRDGDFVKVLDFGIAKLRDAGGGDTTGGVIIGTPNYLAPEQARGADVDGRADLYSVGALLYELVSGRPPFAGRSPVAVLQAHVAQEPPPLRLVAPWVSEGLAAVVHRALRKRPEDRWASADEMRRALLRALGQPSQAGLPAVAPPEADGQLASRADFAEFERQVRRLRRGRVAAPAAALAALALLGLVLWRWPEVHAFLRLRLPAVAGLVPGALRPPERFDGEEHEPNDLPAQADALPLPAGSDGRPGGGMAVVRGHLGARLSRDVGDVDVFRVEVPESGRRLSLLAEWSAAGSAEGIRGLEVQLTLNRDPGQGDRRSAPLVAQSGRGGPGRAARLAALVGPGTYWLAVRERHAETAGPVEKPTDAYELRVRLAEPVPGEEVEPNDDPEAVEHRFHRYAEWRELAERNRLGEGARLTGQLGSGDADTFALAPRGPDERVELVAVLPAPGLAVAAQLWLPDETDLAPVAGDRERFAEAGMGGPGQAVVLAFRPSPAAATPALLRLRAEEGEGSYEVLVLGPGSPSGALLLARLEALAAAGRGPLALELAAAFARGEPASPARNEVLLAAGRAAERLAAATRPTEVSSCEPASRRLGAVVLEAADGAVRYGGAFEALAEGRGPLAEEALHRAATRVLPCAPEEVARRATAFLAAFPGSARAAEVRMRLARAREEAFWRGGEPAALREAVAAYRLVARASGPDAGEAAERVRDLSRPRPARPAVSRLRCE